MHANLCPKMQSRRVTANDTHMTQWVESVMIPRGTHQVCVGGGAQHGGKTYGMELRQLGSSSTLLIKWGPWLDEKGVGQDDNEVPE